MRRLQLPCQIKRRLSEIWRIWELISDGQENSEKRNTSIAATSCTERWTKRGSLGCENFCLALPSYCLAKQVHLLVHPMHNFYQGKDLSKLSRCREDKLLFCCIPVASHVLLSFTDMTLVYEMTNTGPTCMSRAVVGIFSGQVRVSVRVPRRACSGPSKGYSAFPSPMKSHLLERSFSLRRDGDIVRISLP